MITSAIRLEEERPTQGVYDEQEMQPEPRRMRRINSTRLRAASYMIGTSFLVAMLAFVNRYPFVYSDSGTYIRSAFTLLPVADRPIGYSFIIRAITWQSTLWTVVLFQGFMTSWLLFEVLKKVLPTDIKIWRVHFLLLGVLILTTSMPWYMAQIMPDALTPLTVLIIYLLIQAPELGAVKRGFLWLCLFFFLISHNAHVPMTVLLLVVVALWKLSTRGRAFWPGGWRAIGGVVLVALAGIVFVSWYNGRHGLRPVFSPAANVFLAGRLSENRLLEDFLKERCPSRNYALCKYKDELPDIPGDLIWGEGSINTRMGGDLEVLDAAVSPVVFDLLTEPRYLGRYLQSCLVATFVQLFQVSTNSGLVSYYRDSPPYQVINERLRWERSSYITSYQAYNDWDLAVIDRIVHVTLFLTLFLLVWTHVTWSRIASLNTLVVMIISWVFLNAAITASLANVYDRLQSRVTWLLVLCACLALLQSTWGDRVLRNPILRRK